MNNPYRYNTPNGWRDIKEAPKDGTLIEIQNNWGIAPWFRVSRWDGKKWADANDPHSAMASEGPHLSWRPYDGPASEYIDPTMGAQNTSEYWLSACGISDFVTKPEPNRKSGGKQIDGQNTATAIAVIAAISVICVIAINAILAQ